MTTQRGTILSPPKVKSKRNRAAFWAIAQSFPTERRLTLNENQCRRKCPSLFITMLMDIHHREEWRPSTLKDSTKDSSDIHRKSALLQLSWWLFIRNNRFLYFYRFTELTTIWTASVCSIFFAFMEMCSKSNFSDQRTTPPWFRYVRFQWIWHN